MIVSHPTYFTWVARRCLKHASAPARQEFDSLADTQEMSVAPTYPSVLILLVFFFFDSLTLCVQSFQISFPLPAPLLGDDIIAQLKFTVTRLVLVYVKKPQLRGGPLLAFATGM